MSEDRQDNPRRLEEGWAPSDRPTILGQGPPEGATSPKDPPPKPFDAAASAKPPTKPQ